MIKTQRALLLQTATSNFFATCRLCEFHPLFFPHQFPQWNFILFVNDLNKELFLQTNFDVWTSYSFHFWELVEWISTFWETKAKVQGVSSLFSSKLQSPFSNFMKFNRISNALSQFHIDFFLSKFLYLLIKWYIYINRKIKEIPQ